MVTLKSCINEVMASLECKQGSFQDPAMFLFNFL